jgi:uridine phosphorylase
VSLPLALRPVIPFGPDAILVGDPGRALMLAQELIEQPKMSNHARGLWGYTGRTPAGAELTIQSTGMGGPSAAVVLADLAEAGVSRVIRVGTCAGLGDGARRGDLLVVERALGADGVSRSLGAGDPEPDPGLLAALASAGPLVTVRSEDLPASRPAAGAPAPEDDAVAHDLQTAGLLATAGRLEVAATALLIVAEDAAGARLGDEELAAAAKTAGAAAAAAF